MGDVELRCVSFLTSGEMKEKDDDVADIQLVSGG